MKKLLYVLTGLCLLASCKKEEKSFVPKEPKLQEDYTETTFGINMEMVYVKGGEFIMGMTPEQEWDYPDSIIKKYIRKTKLDSYHIGKYEVTQAQWKAVMESDAEPTYSSGKGDDYPVYYVSWNEAQEFCKKLSEQTGKKYVLPTEAMWEYAARGGVHETKTQFAGSNDIAEVAWYNGNSNHTAHPVGKKKANALGIYDMSGNVWEWCSDWWTFGYDKADDYNPQSSIDTKTRVHRGGCWFDDTVNCRVSDRRGYTSSSRSFELGFRVACSSK
ncbi:formylglycine-generating enzyme family protein [bacterium]|nr:formylglycine-generating enzyme family protein [bacterium]